MITIKNRKNKQIATIINVSMTVAHNSIKTVIFHTFRNTIIRANTTATNRCIQQIIYEYKTVAKCPDDLRVFIYFPSPIVKNNETAVMRNPSNVHIYPT